MEKHFEKDFVIISYSNDHHSLVLKWLTTPTREEFREGLNALIPAFEHFKTGKLVADTTNLGAMHPDDQEWSATEWMRKAAKSGYSHIGIVVPENVFTQMSVEDTMSQVKEDDALPTEYFDNPEAALEWINKQ